MSFHLLWLCWDQVNFMCGKVGNSIFSPRRRIWIELFTRCASCTQGQMLRSVFVRGVSMADAVIKAEVTQRPTTSRFLFKALMIIVISYPVLDGALVTMR